MMTCWLAFVYCVPAPGAVLGAFTNSHFNPGSSSRGLCCHKLTGEGTAGLGDLLKVTREAAGP